MKQPPHAAAFVTEAIVLKTPKGEPERRLAVVPVKVWFDGHSGHAEFVRMYGDWFAVVSWSQLTNGVDWTYEAKTSLAFCRERQSAVKVLNLESS